MSSPYKPPRVTRNSRVRISNPQGESPLRLVAQPRASNLVPRKFDARGKFSCKLMALIFTGEKSTVNRRCSKCGGLPPGTMVSFHKKS